jgi:hypothetical protein
VDQPLVVYGRASHEYDFGPHHPFTPRRFDPGIDLLRALGATRFLEPAEASDADGVGPVAAAAPALPLDVSDVPALASPGDPERRAMRILAVRSAYLIAE